MLSRRLVHTKRKVSQKTFEEIVSLFSDWISFPQDFDKKRRNRVYNVFSIFWLFLYQVLSPNGTCQNAVLKAISLFAENKEKTPSPNTGSYCKARKNFPVWGIKKILSTLVERSQQEINEDQLWYGRHVKVVDGTTCTMPDTPKNQKAFPQPDSQKPGCGFPMTRIVALFSLGTGTLLEWRKGPYRESERSLFRSLLDSLEKGIVLLADRGFSSFTDFFFLLSNSVDFVMRVSQKSRKQIQIMKRLGKNDRIVRWFKPKSRPRWMDKEKWNNLPPYIELREITYYVAVKGFRTKKITVVTNLIDKKQFPTHAFKELYLRRWIIELYLRDIKTTLGMDCLSCKTPDMVEKEILMYFIAYNLIRMMIYKSSRNNKVNHEQISFKGTVNIFLQFLPLFESAEKDEYRLKSLMTILYDNIAKLKKPLRPNRREPRAIKRRPKRYQYLTKPRSVFKEDPHRGKRPYS